MEPKDLLEVYKSLFETWRFEVNSHWQRSSYFAAFETVAVAACWELLKSRDAPEWPGPMLAVLGLLLTAVWFLNNRKTHFYAVYWLDAVGAVERKLFFEETGLQFATRIQQRQRGLIRHRHLVQAVPAIFFVAWVTLLLLGFCRTVGR
jgi:hypothetical protein